MISKLMIKICYISLLDYCSIIVSQNINKFLKHSIGWRNYNAVMEYQIRYGNFKGYQVILILTQQKITVSDRRRLGYIGGGRGDFSEFPWTQGAWWRVLHWWWSPTIFNLVKHTQNALKLDHHIIKFCTFYLEFHLFLVYVPAQITNTMFLNQERGSWWYHIWCFRDNSAVHRNWCLMKLRSLHGSYQTNFWFNFQPGGLQKVEREGPGTRVCKYV
jgi:hypothetical protein